uniref:N-acetyltransferase domain-containing protein n=1 Tax=Thermosporothrix sp. COM3 TaxID=2490863 RepID=A0A455SLD5_9CHLR|nr:hypothetical protein KTC_25300 [Thermosporothrix sp. COM3]
MPFATWWRIDFTPEFAPLAGFRVQHIQDIPLLARLHASSEAEMERRMREGNRAYVAFMDDVPTAYGWLATRTGGVSVLNVSFAIPEKSGYLWDFQTLPDWRGHGIYPRLLREIVRQEPDIEHFWIGYGPGNMASERGIIKAGFHIVCDMVVVEGRVVGLELFTDSEQSRESVNVFQLPIIS